MRQLHRPDLFSWSVFDADAWLADGESLLREMVAGF